LFTLHHIHQVFAGHKTKKLAISGEGLNLHQK